MLMRETDRNRISTEQSEFGDVGWLRPTRTSTKGRTTRRIDPVPRTRRRFGMTKADPTDWPRSSRTKLCTQRRQASRVVLKFRVCGWSEDAWDPKHGDILMDSFKTSERRFEVEVPITAVMDTSSVSARTFVSIVVVVPANRSPQTLHVEALSLGESPTTSLSLAFLCLCRSSIAGSGEAFAHTETAVASRFTQQPPRLSREHFGVGLDQELLPNQMGAYSHKTLDRQVWIYRQPFLPVVQHENEDGWSKRVGEGTVSRPRCPRGRSVDPHCFPHRCAYGEQLSTDVMFVFGIMHWQVERFVMC